jgi:Arc/MetJ-type ribon-helix-helix transcriptional regulator
VKTTMGATRITDWYHAVVSRQIAVRLPDEIASFVDAEVAAGRAPSRAAVVARALKRERRRRLALADIEILTRAGGADDFDDLDGLAEYGARLPIDLD